MGESPYDRYEQVLLISLKQLLITAESSWEVLCGDPCTSQQLTGGTGGLKYRMAIVTRAIPALLNLSRLCVLNRVLYPGLESGDVGEEAVQVLLSWKLRRVWHLAIDGCQRLSVGFHQIPKPRTRGISSTFAVKMRENLQKLPCKGKDLVPGDPSRGRRIQL